MNVAILGYGTVGKGVYDIIKSLKEQMASNRHYYDFRKRIAN